MLSHPDPRRLDLRASLTDPFGQFRVRLYEQRCAIQVFAILDLSGSMDQRGTHPKMPVLADFVEGLAASVYRQGDTLGILGAAEKIHPEFSLPPTRQPGPAFRLAGRLRRYAPQGTHCRGLELAGRMLPRRRSLVFLVSDCHAPLVALRDVLAGLAHHDWAPVLVWDAAETLPQGRGLVRLADLEGGGDQLLALRPALRARLEDTPPAPRPAGHAVPAIRAGTFVLDRRLRCRPHQPLFPGGGVRPVSTGKVGKAAAALVLAMAASLAEAAPSIQSQTVAPSRPFHLEAPPAYGYAVGDTIRHVLAVDLEPGYRLDEASLPKPGPLNRWLELRRVAVEPGPGARFSIALEYQTFYVPLTVKALAIPGFALRFNGTAGITTAAVPAWPFSMSPVHGLAVSAEGGLDALQADAPPEAPDPATPLRRSGGFALAGLVALAYLGHLRGFWGFGPCGRHFREARLALSRLETGGNEAEVLRAGHADAQAELAELVGEGDPAFRARVLYDLGNVYFRQALATVERGEAGRAAPLAELAKDAYRHALRTDPGYRDAKYNLEAASRLMPDFDPVDNGTELPDEEAARKLWTRVPGFPRGLP